MSIADPKLDCSGLKGENKELPFDAEGKRELVKGIPEGLDMEQ